MHGISNAKSIEIFGNERYQHGICNVKCINLGGCNASAMQKAVNIVMCHASAMQKARKSIAVNIKAEKIDIALKISSFDWQFIGSSLAKGWQKSGSWVEILGEIMCYNCMVGICKRRW